ncbi:unnamed protein product [Ceutorhynchus assimilis]|uniref:Protein SMG5 n=1 Tax=Ceutorhynchus assimilis TaxID=467358 RepID=A0A9P0DE69_9CUCU|nr:unnamed protein product [Ceutorhynchus assimilis]
MKKVYNPTTDIQKKESQELSKKLYRTISEQAKLLDDARSRVRNISDLFTPVLLSQRRKFCDYCDRLIFSDPLLYGRRGEELLWRKGFYEAITTAKKLKKQEFSVEEKSSIEAHIYAGIGFYHHMLSKLNFQFNIPLNNIVDCEMILEPENNAEQSVSLELEEWAKQSIHQCLIYLGDLSRYKFELKPNNEPVMAARYYLQAVSFKPDYGMPHNQMGTLAMNQNYFLEAVYHYLRCLACKFPFEGTANNLQSLFEKNSKYIEGLPHVDEEADSIIEPEKSDHIKQFIARFLLLIDIWYFDKKVPNVYALCHQTYKNLEDCLAYTKPTASESGDSPTTDIELSEGEPSFLSGQMIFRVVMICLLTIAKLQTTNSPPLSTLIAFTLSIYSQIIKKLSNHIEEAVLKYPLSHEHKKSYGVLNEIINLGKKKSKLNLRRRKALKIANNEDSDLSENDHESDYSSSDDSFISDIEDVLVDSSDEELDIIKVSDESIAEKSKHSIPNGIKHKEHKSQMGEPKNKESIYKKVQKMDVNVMLEIINEEGLLQSIRVVNDWLKSDQEIIKSCATNTKTLIRQMMRLANLINLNLSNFKALNINYKVLDIINNENKIPLAEDIILKGISTFKDAQSNYDWNFLLKKQVTSREEAIIRIIKILSFGKILTNIEETGISYNEDKNIFTCNFEDDKTVDDNGVSAAAVMEELERQETNSTPSKMTNGESKTENGLSHLNKMKQMGQLWLAAEVRALEIKVGRAKVILSPYLVLDTDALVKHTHMVKQLVFSRQFILLVPETVISALDDLKKEKIEARQVIRWLEIQFQRGNRFFRPQRPHERLPIPFVKYPKKKDKEMHTYIQLIECCHYFADQQKSTLNMVTCLIGANRSALLLSNGENKDFSYAGLANSVGITLESITSFYGKWKKSKGNNR